jgi:hypothetical protein
MFHRGKKGFILFAISLTVMCSCDGSMMAEKGGAIPSMGESSKADLQRISKKKIYFGHMSVGENILDGVRDIMREHPDIQLNIVETNSPSSFDQPIFAHSRIGNNGDPKSKIDAFVQYMDGGIGNSADIAFFKFCYIDILSATDADEVFNRYRTAIEILKRKYPKVTFVHVTAPLRVVQTGFLVPIKKIISRPLGGYEDNIKRKRFNDLLRQEYEGKDPIFDLARIESTYPDGRQSTFDNEEKSYEALVAVYTYDGGHLNEIGRKIVAGQLLSFLPNLSK